MMLIINISSEITEVPFKALKFRMKNDKGAHKTRAG